ncbi:MAG: hypothetical protein ACRC20_06700 [Segniliparus sp.]|uniref:hypothetical protein n=1 Tax=Segniliparus sp. TaxID=2804064 RepID=UPI003F311CEB
MGTEQAAAFNEFGSTQAPSVMFTPPPSAPASSGFRSSAPSAPSTPASAPVANSLMNNSGLAASNIAQQPANINAIQNADAAKQAAAANPQQGAALSQQQAPQQQATPAAQTHSAPPPVAQPAAPAHPTPAAQTVQASASAPTSPMSPGIREGAIPLHQQPASTGYQAVPAQPVAPPPVQPGYQQIARGVDPVTGSYTGTQATGANPYPVPTQAQVFPWQDRDRRKSFLTGAPSAAAWWDEAVRMLLKGRRMRGDDDGSRLSRIARLLVAPPAEGAPGWGLVDGALAPEYAFVFARHVDLGPVWYFTSNQGPQLAPLSADGVPAEVRPALESWPGEWSEAMALFGRSESASLAAVRFAEGMQRLKKIDQVYAVVSTEKLGQDARDAASRLNANVALSEDEHLAETVVLDLPTAVASVPGFQTMKLGETAWAHPLATANRPLYDRLGRLANAIPEKGEQGWGAPGWRADALSWLGTVWIESALRAAPTNWANGAHGWSAFVSVVTDSLANIAPGAVPRPRLDTLWQAFDNDAKAYAPMTLRSARAWQIGNIAGVPESERWQLEAALDPAQAGMRAERAGFTFDIAWQVVLAWQAARVVGSKAWGAEDNAPQHPQTWIHDLGYLVHKLRSGNLAGAGAALGQLDRFEAWASAHDPHGSAPMPDLRRFTV